MLATATVHPHRVSPLIQRRDRLTALSVILNTVFLTVLPLTYRCFCRKPVLYNNMVSQAWTFFFFTLSAIISSLANLSINQLPLIHPPPSTLGSDVAYARLIRARLVTDLPPFCSSMRGVSRRCCTNSRGSGLSMRPYFLCFSRVIACRICICMYTWICRQERKRRNVWKPASIICTPPPHPNILMYACTRCTSLLEQHGRLQVKEGFLAIIPYCVNSIDQRRSVVALVVSFHFIFVFCVCGLILFYFRGYRSLLRADGVKRNVRNGCKQRATIRPP